MAVIYMVHPKHGAKVAIDEAEVAYDEAHGWERVEVEDAAAAAEEAPAPARAPAPAPAVEPAPVNALSPRPRGRPRRSQED